MIDLSVAMFLFLPFFLYFSLDKFHSVKEHGGICYGVGYIMPEKIKFFL